MGEIEPAVTAPRWSAERTPRFGLSLESAQATNTQGTSNVLKFASECRGLRKFAYVSTVALTRQTPKISELNLMSGVVAHQGDITRPNLGVDDRTCSHVFVEPNDQDPREKFPFPATLGSPRSGSRNFFFATWLRRFERRVPARAAQRDKALK